MLTYLVISERSKTGNDVNNLHEPVKYTKMVIIQKVIMVFIEKSQYCLLKILILAKVCNTSLQYQAPIYCGRLQCLRFLRFFLFILVFVDVCTLFLVFLVFGEVLVLLSFTLICSACLMLLIDANAILNSIVSISQQFSSNEYLFIYLDSTQLH